MLELAIDLPRSTLHHFHAADRAEERRLMCHDFDRFGETVLAGELAKSTTGKPVDQAGKPTDLLGFQAVDAGHDVAPLETDIGCASGVPVLVSDCVHLPGRVLGRDLSDILNSGPAVCSSDNVKRLNGRHG